VELELFGSKISASPSKANRNRINKQLDAIFFDLAVIL